MKLLVQVMTGLLLLSAPALAEDTCNDSETIGECFSRLIGEDAGRASTEAESKDKLEGKATGIQAADSTLVTALTDFIPLFALSAETGDLGQDEEVLALDFNFDLMGIDARNLKLQVQLREARLYGPLKMALPEDVRSQRTETLEKTMDDFDDATVVLGWNMTSSSMGRSFLHHNVVYGELFDAVLNRARAAVDTDRLTAELLSMTDRINNLLPDETDPTEIRFADIADEAERSALKVHVARTAKSESLLEKEVQKQAKITAFFRFSDLINNQPQLSAFATYRPRNDLAGPDELAAKVSYEIGFGNVNSFLRWCGTQDLDQDKLTCLERYIAVHGQRINASNRASVSVEYTSHEEYMLELPEDMVTLDLDSERTLTFAGAYGRYLGIDDDGRETSRFDVSAQYQDFSNDAVRQDRAIFTATYTQKINDSANVVLGLSWANRGEFLPEDDDRLTANVGVSYKLAPPKK